MGGNRLLQGRKSERHVTVVPEQRRDVFARLGDRLLNERSGGREMGAEELDRRTGRFDQPAEHRVALE
jgi:hypothetical protein